MNNFLIKICFLFTFSVLAFLSLNNLMLNLNAFVLLIYSVFFSFVNYRKINSINILHISWIAISLSLALDTNNSTAQIIFIGILPLTLLIEDLKYYRMKMFGVIQTLSLVLFLSAIVMSYFKEMNISLVLLLLALLIRQVQFPFHFWIKEIKRNQDRYPSYLFFIIAQSGFILYAQEYIYYKHSYLILYVVPAITLITGLLTAVSALRERNSLIRHLLLLISQSCLPLAAYHSFSTTTAIGGVLFSMLLAASGGVYSLMAFHIYIQKGILNLDSNFSLYRTNKNLGLIYFVTGLSIVGLPFTMGFFAEDILFHGLVVNSPFFAIFYILVTAINAYSVFRTFNMLFFGHTQVSWSPIYFNRVNKILISISFLLITVSGFFAGPIASSIEKRLILNNQNSSNKVIVKNEN